MVNGFVDFINYHNRTFKELLDCASRSNSSRLRLPVLAKLRNATVVTRIHPFHNAILVHTFRNGDRVRTTFRDALFSESLPVAPESSFFDIKTQIRQDFACDKLGAI
jgi:hypothetical protein